MHWYQATGYNAARLKQFLADPFTAQTPIAASYGLLQMMYGKAIEVGWNAAGQRNPSMLFDREGVASTGEGSLVAGTVAVRGAVLDYSARKGGLLPPDSYEDLLALFLKGWERYNSGEDGYENVVATQTLLFLPRPQAPVLPQR